MQFVYHENTVQVNNFQIPFELFVRLEPTFVDLSAKYKTIVYRKDINHYQVTLRNTNQTRKFLETKWEDGDRFIAREKDYRNYYELFRQEAEENQQALKTELLKNVAYDVARKEEYPHIDELIVAMWEYIVEGKETKLQSVQEKRKQIKDKYPKP
jgi:hypothetical protein